VIDRKLTFKQGRKVTLVGVFVNAALVAVKFLGGIYGNSQALIADAVHSISDFATDVVVLVGLKMGSKDPDPEHHFGHARLETVASSVIGLSLLAVAVFIGYDAARDVYLRTEHHPGILASFVAAFSILAKEALYRYTIIVGRRIDSQAVIANAWHHRSDAMSSVAVLIGVGAARLYPPWHILDAYAALVVSIFVAKAGLDVLWGSIREFTDAAPSPEIVNLIESCARSQSGVLNVHDLKVRLFGGRYLMELHIVVDGDMTVTEGHRIAKTVEKCVLEEVDKADKVTVHVDPNRKEEPHPSGGPVEK
jgi:cation diffusion facilitator family transporter